MQALDTLENGVILIAATNRYSTIDINNGSLGQVGHGRASCSKFNISGISKE